MPIGSPAPQSDFCKSSIGHNTCNLNSVATQNVIRPESVRAVLGPPQPLPLSSIGTATSVIRLSPASVTSHQILRPIIVDPMKLIPVLPNADTIKNGVTTGPVYQWHSLLPVIQQTSCANHNIALSSVVQVAPMNMLAIKKNASANMDIVENNLSENRMYDNDEDADDDDVFEAESTKKNDNHMDHMENPMVDTTKRIFDEPLNGKQDNDADATDSKNCLQERDIEERQSVNNKRRTQSCSALQANNQGSFTKVC